MKIKFIPVSAVGIALAAISVLMGTACSKDNTTAPVPIAATTTTLPVNFSGNSSFTFFSFKNNAVVAATDSASTKWDFALRLTTFLVNSNASGPGSAGVIVKDSIFDNFYQAPASGYAYDTASNRLAIKDGSWYNYDVATHAFVPKAGKVFIFRTADNKYAKMEIISATYEPFVGPVPQKIDYKFRFVYQPDGSGNVRNQ